MARRAMAGLMGFVMIAALVAAAGRGPATTEPEAAGALFGVTRTLSFEPALDTAGNPVPNSLRLTLREYPAGTVVSSASVSVTAQCEPQFTTASTALVSLGITPSGSSVRFVDNGLGSKISGGNCGGNSGRVVKPQAITIGLGAALQSQGYVIAKAELNVEARQGATLTSTISGGGAADVTVTGQALPGVVGGGNGANSAGNDNTMITLQRNGGTAGFTNIVLTPTAGGELALDTGADSPLSNDLTTVLYLSPSFEFEVPCWTSATGPSYTADQIPVGTTTPELKVEYFRFENGSKGAACKNIGLQVDFDQTSRDEIVVNPSSIAADGSFQDPQSRVRLTWRVETQGKSAADIEAELARQIDYQDGTGVKDVVYCPSFTPETGKTAVQALGTITRSTTQDWCLLSDTRTLEGTVIIQVQIYDAYGDPKFF